MNAKNHAKEAEIVAQAGRYGAVTIATNMAGRGTDIMLGGNADFMARRKLRKLGFEEHMIELAAGKQEVDDPETLECRRQYNELYSQFKRRLTRSMIRWRRRAAYIS